MVERSKTQENVGQQQRRRTVRSGSVRLDSIRFNSVQFDSIDSRIRGAPQHMLLDNQTRSNGRRLKEGSRCGRTRRRQSPPHLPRVAWSTHRPPIHPIAYVHASQVWRAREHPTSGRGVLFLTHIDIAVRSRRRRSIYATAVTPSHRVPLYHYQPGPARSSLPLLHRPLPDDDIDCRCCGCVRLDPHLADDRLLIGHPTPSPYNTPT